MQTFPQCSGAGRKLASPSTPMVCGLWSHALVQSCCSKSEGVVTGTDFVFSWFQIAMAMESQSHTLLRTAS